MNKWFKFGSINVIKVHNILVPVLSVLLGFIIGAIILLISGYNPFEAYAALLRGAGFLGSLRRFGDTLLNTTTLILTGLSVAFAFRTGLFNIGAPGQMLIGGFCGVMVGIKLDAPKAIHLPLAVIVAAVAGALWAFLPGFLKAAFRIHEVVTTIMMNWISLWSVYYFVPTFIPNAGGTESVPIQPSASLRAEWITRLFKGSYVNMGVFIAIAAIIVVWFILQKTTFGFELKAVGYNHNAAQYAGMKVNRNIILSMMIAGALAGLAGATFYLGYSDTIKTGILPSQGYDGIAVALVGLSSPIGIIFSAFLFGFMNAGKLFMQSSANVPNELVPIINGIIIFFSAANLLMRSWLLKFGNRMSKMEGGK